MPHAFIGVVVQVQMRYFDIAGRQRFRVHAETMILRGNLDLIGEKILYRMVRTVMAELQLEGLTAKSQSANLMAEADPEDRNLADELSDRLNGVFHWFGVARTIGKKDAIGLHSEHVFGGRRRRNHSHVTIVIGQQP